LKRRADRPGIGFPAPLLGGRPVRVPVLAEGGSWLALDKPAGVAARGHPWDRGIPDLDAALNRQLEEGKPELAERGARCFASVHYADPPATGVALFAKNREAMDRWRNAHGSGALRFVFLFVSRCRDVHGAHSATCETPLLKHRSKPKMVPSTRRGRKSRTTFHRLAEGAGGWTVWRAQTDHVRPHQIRAHAALTGIPVACDAVYAGGPVPSPADLDATRRGPGARAPIFAQPPLHALRIAFDASPDANAVEAPLPREWRNFLRKAGLDPEAVRAVGGETEA